MTDEQQEIIEIIKDKVYCMARIEIVVCKLCGWTICGPSLSENLELLGKHGEEIHGWPQVPLIESK